MPEQFADPTLILFGKLALATLLGTIIGTERAIVGKRAGTRTFALVALGACLFIVVSNFVNSAYLGFVNFDPLRVSAAIVTGVGFIGAGLIVIRSEELRGLTTAAGLWVAAAVGTAVGFGLYAIAVFTTVLVLMVFSVLWFVENTFKQRFGLSQPAVVEKTDEDPSEHV